jgi:hypothetical protein
MFLVTMFAACTFWMCTETEFENNSVNTNRSLDRASLSNNRWAIDSADTVCATLVTAIRGLGACKVLLQTDDSVTLNPVQPNQTLIPGNRYRIGYQFSNQPTRCIIGKGILLSCIQPADSTGSTLRPGNP